MNPIPHCVMPEFLPHNCMKELITYAADKAWQFTSKEGTAQFGQISEQSHQPCILTDLGDLAHSISNSILAAAIDAARQCELSSFEDSRVEVQMMSINDGGFVQLQRDDEACQTRLLSCVYFFHREPKRFRGGILQLQSSDAKNQCAIEPIQNTMVLFRSSVHCEVQPVRLAPPKFADSRLTINAWIHAVG